MAESTSKPDYERESATPLDYSSPLSELPPPLPYRPGGYPPPTVYDFPRAFCWYAILSGCGTQVLLAIALQSLGEAMIGPGLCGSLVITPVLCGLVGSAVLYGGRRLLNLCVGKSLLPCREEKYILAGIAHGILANAGTITWAAAVDRRANAQLLMATLTVVLMLLVPLIGPFRLTQRRK